MPLILNGTTGVSGVDGTAATPAAQGGDNNTGVFYGTDTVSISTGGTARVVVNSSGQTVLGAGTAALPAVTTTGDTNTGMFFPAADTIGFVEGGVESMRLDSSGNLGLGVTPSAWSNNYKSLQVGGVGSGFAAVNSSQSVITQNAVFNGGWKYATTDFANYIEITNGSYRFNVAPSGTAGNAISFTQAMTLDASGNLTISGATATKASGTTWANPSDIRLKDNVRDYGRGLDDLKNVRVRIWEYNGKGGTISGSPGMGVVADEIVSVLPQTVTEYDAKLNPDDETETKIKRFDATEITWLLVKSVQELSAKLDAAEARIAALEAK